MRNPAAPDEAARKGRPPDPGLAPQGLCLSERPTEGPRSSNSFASAWRSCAPSGGPEKLPREGEERPAQSASGSVDDQGTADPTTTPPPAYIPHDPQRKVIPMSPHYPHSKPHDEPCVRAAIQALTERNIRFTRPSSTHIKVGDFNFYPTTGTINRDGERKSPQRGLEAFLALLQNVQLAPRNVVPFGRLAPSS